MKPWFDDFVRVMVRIFVNIRIKHRKTSLRLWYTNSVLCERAEIVGGWRIDYHWTKALDT